MGKKPTIVDVARLANVTPGTVSRALNGQAGVSAAVRARIESAVRDLGYSTSVAARTMRAGSTHIVSCHVSDLSNPLLTAIYLGIESRLLRSGYTLLVHGTEYDEARECAALNSDIARSVDAIITIGGPRDHAVYEDALAHAGIPVVCVDRIGEVHDTIFVDHEAGGRAAVRHLVELGHRCIGLVVPPTNLCAPAARVRGYRAELAAAGLPFDPSLLHDESDGAFTTEALHAFLGGDDPPTALIVLANRMLARVLTHLRETGRRVGRDLSLISVGRSRLAELYDPEITMIDWDVAALGEVAAEAALSRLAAEAAERPRRLRHFPTRLVIGRSCAAPATGRERLPT